MNPHEQYMSDALTLALRGRGFTSPNPIVGAVVVQDDDVVGSGFHAQFGGPHAEVAALQEAGPRARGATLYVTLEPCAHQGKTPPCVEALLAAGIRTVVLGARDPNPLAAGGLEALRAKGVEVLTGVLEESCREQNAPFFKAVRTGLPLVSAKWAMTADGKIATARGDSHWITAPKARAFAHGLRAAHDAVLLGIRTVIRDAPLLTVRLGLRGPEAGCWQPRRVVLDSHGRMPLEAPLWTAENGGPIVIAVSEEAPAERRAALEEKGAEVLVLPREGELLSVRALLEGLLKLGVLSVFVEGGAEVLGSFLDQRAVDRVYVFIAPKIIGGREGLTAVRGRGVNQMSECQEMKPVRLQTFGDDVLIEGRLGEWPWLAPVVGK